MNTIKSHLEHIIALCKQATGEDCESKILPTSAIYRIEIKAEKALQDIDEADALLCRVCKGIGVTNDSYLTVNLECSKDE